ncbi:citrate lyase holo-[acyl-carrier protein] synthase [Providencia huaxiensis]|uniref:citrate lyase holo-[acyl-carrier protein] synthase n=1 Tax=Providencia TaxID=586 RepID=UPI001B37D3D8|nr:MULTISPECIES: citrate lyase holo-[acyl-carrier protein] synthase [Providencia]EIL1984837.1 citrate lyase holo-[acyl-carrier protein] synthase [Providencia rettgeri]EIU9517309.1 citrate lyase holo-[acyl-carrier protein] synthase [Providencia rettgeri]EJD6370269.1 citrate lyase holo-[acyl-carrier protein] synthase [Providencia rettgeri]EJD6372974.1 citrate lyase holo-[acyl-carrier protein] synthase [Providencia rettgeri]EJD6409160.1 citrate lyase holo-[acyl-carrier protein] synthase [Providen
MFYPLPDTQEQFEISLPELLDSRDARQARQQQWIGLHQVTLISFTVVFPGAVKDNSLVRHVFNQGLNALKQIASRRQWVFLSQQSWALKTGPECLAAVDVDAIEIKKALIEIEELSPVGRLWDFDVFDANGQQYSRSQLNLSSRRCLVCEYEAKVCARHRTHPLGEILNRIEELANATR